MYVTMLENSPSRNGWIIIAFSYGVFLFVLCFTLLVCSGSVRVYGLFTLERRKYDFCRNKCVYRTQYQNPPPRADRGVCNNRSFKPPQSATISGPPLESISIALRFHLNASIDGRPCCRARNRGKRCANGQLLCRRWVGLVKYVDPPTHMYVLVVCCLG